MIFKKIQLFALLFYLLFFISCEKDNEDIYNNPVKINRTIIVYMAADNDLSEDALNNIEDMKKGVKGNDVNILVFVDLKNENPSLLKLSENRVDTIKTYSTMNTADPLVLNNILNEVISMYPADELGLILWSHGTSWLPANSQLRSFVDDSGKQMNISDLAKNLPVRFDFILFDACLMGSVEVAYELKDKSYHRGCLCPTFYFYIQFVRSIQTVQRNCRFDTAGI